MKRNGAVTGLKSLQDDLKDYLKRFKRFKEDHRKKMKIAAALSVIAAAVLFFGFKGEIQNSYGEEELRILSETMGSEETVGILDELEDSFPVIYVDISGAVKEPGVYDVKEGTRVFEVIEMAGGLTSEADIDGFNRAEEVFDGQKLTIPEKTDDGSESDSTGSSAVTSSGLININRATAEELDQLPGVGPATAQAIIEYREENGSFRKKEDIKNVSGIGEKTYEKMQDKITV